MRSLVTSVTEAMNSSKFIDRQFIPTDSRGANVQLGNIISDIFGRRGLLYKLGNIKQTEWDDKITDKYISIRTNNHTKLLSAIMDLDSKLRHVGFEMTTGTPRILHSVDGRVLDCTFPIKYQKNSAVLSYNLIVWNYGRNLFTEDNPGDIPDIFEFIEDNNVDNAWCVSLTTDIESYAALYNHNR